MEVVSTLIDVTERKRAEQALRESEYKLRQIIETVPGLIWSNGPDGEPTHINQRMLDFSGMRFEDFKLRGWEAFVHPADFPETAAAFYYAIQTGSSYEGVMRLRRANGEFRWHHARCEPLRDRQGCIIQWYGLSVDVEERKQAEDRLRRSEAYLAEAQRLTHIGVAAYNDTAILYGSEETYRIWGFDPAQGVPSREAVFQRIHPDDLDRMQAEVQRALGEKRRYWTEYRIVLPDGTVKHLESIGAPEFSASGELVEIVATQIDVTERKRVAQALRESEARFRDFAESASDWLWEIGPDYKFTLLTDNAFGSNAADRIGTACWDGALDLETEPEKWRLLWATLNSHKPFRDFVYCSMGDNGSPMYVKASGKPVFDANGEFRGYRGAGADVTEQEQLTQELQRREAYLAEAQRLSQTGSWAWSPDQDIRYWSEECYRVLSFDPKDGLPRFEEFVQRIHPDDRPGFRELIQTAIREKAEWEADYRIVHLDGPVRDIHVVGHPVLSTSGHLVEFVGTVIDVTERRRAEQERARLRQLEADLAHINRVSTLGEMAASLAHEITQPIAAARNNARAALNFLDQQPPDLGEVREALGCVVGDADRAGSHRRSDS